MDDVTDKVRRESFMIIETQPELIRRKGLKGDYGNLALLIFLYILQGIPLGIVMTIPLILASNNVSYSLQAIFTFARYPYVMKLLWAPIIDSVYSKRFGRRKTWLVPAQYFLSGSMVLLSSYVDKLIGDKTHPPHIYLLTASMFFIIFLTATQDIAVDAWAISLLARRNVHYASSCNSVGVVFGMFLSNTLFLSLESAEFCNKWLRRVPQAHGMVTINEFFFFSGITFALMTTFILFFKKENSIVDDDEDRVKGIWNTYKVLFNILKLRTVQLLASIQVTQYVGHAVVTHVTDLKLVQFGVRRENLALLKSPIAIFNLVLPFIVVHKSKKSPLTIFWKWSFIKLITGCFVVGVVYWTQTFHRPKSGFPVHYYVTLFAVLLIYDIARYAMGMSIWAFKVKIADPMVGATYMTMLTTLSNVGAKWPATLSMWLVDIMTVRVNVPFLNKILGPLFSVQHAVNKTSTFNETSMHNGTVRVTGVEHSSGILIDGYYTEFVLCTILGLIWLFGYKSLLWRMQEWPESSWRYIKTRSQKFGGNKQTKF